jgi:hypothetical protein
MEQKENKYSKALIDERILKEIYDAVEGIKFGEIVITIHDKHIVQIEKKEKKRFK